MGTVRSEDYLERIATALEGINQELGSISNSLCDMGISADKLADLAECINGYRQFCITGDVTTR